MKLSPLARIALACAMAGALLIALAYWWFDNLPHELIGSLMFTLLGWHLWTNRRWFTRIATGKYDLSRTIVLLLHFALLASMVALFVTSIVISKAVFSLLPFPERIYLSDVHWFAAYWTVVLIGIHLGLHWRRVMAIGFSASRMPTSRWTIWPLRVIAIASSCYGVWSFWVLGVWTKLTFNYSLEFWDFKVSVAPFFGHWSGVMALAATVSHYALRVFSMRPAGAGIFGRQPSRGALRKQAP